MHREFDGYSIWANKFYFLITTVEKDDSRIIDEESDMWGCMALRQNQRKSYRTKRNIEGIIDPKIALRFEKLKLP